NRHKQGKNLHVCEVCENIYYEVCEACSLYDEYYISEMIDKVREFRVVVLEGRVLYMYEKIPEDPSVAAWNHAQGAETPNLKWGDWHLPSVRASLLAMELSGLDFGGVDVMIDSEGRAYVLEVNTAPETT